MSTHTLTTFPAFHAKRLMGGVCTAALAFGLSHSAVAQVEITDARTAPVTTDDEGNDVTITSAGSVT